MDSLPEQFGYGQTTVRSDVHALGMLLRFCLTEKTVPRFLGTSNMTLRFPVGNLWMLIFILMGIVSMSART